MTQQRLTGMEHSKFNREQWSRFPRSRYQGSKRRTAARIVETLLAHDFDSVLDVFGGTGAVAYAFKCAGKAVTYNDLLTFNQQIGLALIENDSVRIPLDVIDSLASRKGRTEYSDWIERTFPGIYFTDEENRWLDTAVANVASIQCGYARAMHWFPVLQAAMAKRPYNLFHRRNLYMRTADVARSFGNKASWDRSFDQHVRAFTAEANRAVFQGDQPCRALCTDALELEVVADLVYFDPPYVSRSGIGVDYHHFYHFLEGLVRYDEWPAMIDARTTHKRLARRQNPWCDGRESLAQFRQLFDRHRGSILAVSYRDDGIPTIDALVSAMKDFKPRVTVVDASPSQYALSTRRGTREALIVGHA